MQQIWNFYLDLTIKLRLSLLCACYSLCLAASALAAQADSVLIKYGSVAPPGSPARSPVPWGRWPP